MKNENFNNNIIILKFNLFCVGLGCLFVGLGYSNFEILFEIKLLAAYLFILIISIISFNVLQSRPAKCKSLNYL
jgi:hypothetical protein